MNIVLTFTMKLILEEQVWHFKFITKVLKVIFFTIDSFTFHRIKFRNQFFSRQFILISALGSLGNGAYCPQLESFIGEWVMLSKRP